MRGVTTKMPNQKTDRLNNVFTNWFIGKGIFKGLDSYNPPWKSSISYRNLDLEYHGNVSGNKIISPLLEKTLYENYDFMLSEYAGVIYSLFGAKWGKLWNTMNLEYNPIENYRMTEIMTDDETVNQYGKTITRTDNLTHAKTGTEQNAPNITDTRTDDLTHTKTGTEQNALNITDTRTDNLTHAKTGTEQNSISITDTRTDNLIHSKTGTEQETPNITETTTPNLTTAGNNAVYGFNSNSAVDTDETTTTATGTNTVTKTGTDTTTYNTQDTETGTQTNQKAGTETKTYNTEDADTGTQITRKSGTETKTYNTEDADTGTQTIRKTGTDTTTYNTTESDRGTQTNAETGTDSHTRNYELTRSGNIGVTTSQQMIEAERQLLMWDYFHTVVFPDIDRVLTIQIY